MSRRPSAMSSCALCPWKAQMTADTVDEIVAFLHIRLLEHLLDRHPDHHATGPLPVVIRTAEEEPA